MQLQRVQTSKVTVVLLGALAVALGIAAQRQFVDNGNRDGGLILWAIALAAFFGALYVARRSNPPPTVLDKQGDQPEALAVSTEALCFLAIVAVGAFFRFYRIDSIPPGLNHDAAWEGLYAIRITQGVDYAPVVSCCDSFARETMFFYVVAFFQTLLGPTRFALQLSSVVIGLATLAAVHLFLRRIFDVRLSLIATFLLAISGWHITFSRVGWRLILVPLFTGLLFYFLVKAVQLRRPRDFLLAGCFLGLSLATYEAARILPFIVAAFLAYELARSPTPLREYAPSLLLFAASALLTFAPVGWYMSQHWTAYTQRSDALWIGNQITEAGSLTPLFDNIKSAFLMFNFRGNGDDFFVAEPLLDVPVSVFFVLGVAYSLTQWRRRGYFLLLVMSLLTLAICVASKPNGNRAIVALIPAVTFAAAFLFEAWRWLVGAFPKYAGLFSVLLIGILLYSGFATYDSYLGPDRRVQAGHDGEATIVGEYIDSLTDNYQVYAVAGDWAGFTLTYLTYPGEGDPFTPVYTYSTVAVDLMRVPPAADRGTAFIIKVHPAGTDVYNRLSRRFPAATRTAIPAKDASQPDVAYVLLIPPGGGAGANLTAYIPDGGEQRDTRRRDDLAAVATALSDLRARDGSVPSTGGEIVIACVLGRVGPLCPLESQVGTETLADPRGSPLQNGYWYQSDGSSFTLYASFEALPPAENACHPRDEILADKLNLYCLNG